MAVTINKAPVSQEELGVILLVNSMSKYKGVLGRNLNRMVSKALESLCNQGLVEISGGKPSLTDKANTVLGCIESGEARNYLALAEQMRKMFPVGMKTDTGKPWRSSPTVTATRLKYLIETKGYRFTDEEILEATRLYVDRMQHDQYMRTLQYFIYKYKTDDKGEKELVSDLDTWIQILRDGEEAPTTDDDPSFY